LKKLILNQKKEKIYNENVLSSKQDNLIWKKNFNLKIFFFLRNYNNFLMESGSKTGN